MLTLYSIPESLYCAKTRILLRHKGLKWQELSSGTGYDSQEFKSLVPSGSLPTLVDGELLIADSEAIAEYLNEKFPEPPMLPADLAQRARIREKSRFHDTRLEPALRLLFPQVSPTKRNAEFVEIQSQNISARLHEFAKMYAGIDRSTPETLTIGDCGFPITFAWLDAFIPAMELDIKWPHTVIEYRRRMGTLAAVSDELDDYNLKISAWVDSKL